MSEIQRPATCERRYQKTILGVAPEPTVIVSGDLLASSKFDRPDVAPIDPTLRRWAIGAGLVSALVVTLCIVTRGPATPTAAGAAAASSNDDRAPSARPAPPAIVPPATPTELRAARVPKPCTLAIRSTPPDADVFVDGRAAGRTPAPLVEAACDHPVTVALAKPGFKRWEQHVSASSEETTPVAATMQPITGRLTIDSAPAGAIAWIADHRLGPTPVSANVAASVSTTVTLRLSGHRPYQLRVVPSANRESRIFARLVPEPLIAAPDWDQPR